MKFRENSLLDSSIRGNDTESVERKSKRKSEDKNITKTHLNEFQHS
jgi:hypothetical protein